MGTGTTKPLNTLAIFPFKQLLCIKTVRHQTNALKIKQIGSGRLELDSAVFIQKNSLWMWPLTETIYCQSLLHCHHTNVQFRPRKHNWFADNCYCVYLSISEVCLFVFFLGVSNHPLFNLFRQSRTLPLLIKYFWWNKMKSLSFQSVLVTELFCSACET